MSESDRSVLRRCSECEVMLYEGENVELSDGTYCEDCAAHKEEQPLATDGGAEQDSRERERSAYDAKPLTPEEWADLLKSRREFVLRVSDGTADGTARFWVEDGELYWRPLTWTSDSPAELAFLEDALEGDSTTQLLIERSDGATTDCSVSDAITECGQTPDKQKEAHRLGTINKWDAPDHDWTAEYDWTRSRGPAPYPVPGGWVLGGVEADGTGWHYYGAAGVDEWTDTNLDPDDREAEAMLLIDIADEDASLREEPDMEWSLTVDGTDVFRRVEPDREDAYAAVARALRAYHDGKLADAEIVPSSGRKPDDVREEEAVERKQEENESLDRFVTDGGREQDAEETDRLTPELVSTEVVSTRSDIEEFLSSLEVPVHNKWVDIRRKELGAFDYDDVRLVVSYHFEEVEPIDSKVARPDGGHRPPCDAVANVDPTPPTEEGFDLERRVCPNCRLYFDTGADSDSVFCSDACRRRHERGELVADGGRPETRVGHTKADSTDVYAGRGPGGRSMADTDVGARGWLGNPYALDDGYDREQSLTLFREEFETRLRVDDEFRADVRELAGETLGCWCQRLDEDSPACHAEIIAEWADRLADGEEVADAG